ncbi:MAG: autotransporter domain-containing protein [Proteobacteria bacterium]|nr:autotransporter domain-containing protein [Pseudomonadota bacterium]
MFHHVAFLALCLLTFSQAQAITLTSAQSDYTTDSDITTTASNTSGAGINSTRAGTSSSPRKIRNIHVITTSGSSAYGIRTTGDYNQITNQGTISTSNSSGRGISVAGDFSSANNTSVITTLGSSAYGIYFSAGTNSAANITNYSTITNSGTISAADAHGIYANDVYTQIINSGTITGGSDNTDYGIRIDGANSTLTNSGTISGTKYAIYNEGGGTIINNSGTLNGGVRIGNGTLNISGGAISGIVDGSDLATVNITSDFTQSEDFLNLNILNISAGTFSANNNVDAANISISSGAILALNSTSSLSGEISGDGTLSISSDATFTPENDVFIGNISVGGTLDLSTVNNLTMAGNVVGDGSGIINVGTNSQIVSGNFSLLSGDTLKISGNSDGFGSLDVTGLATVSSGSKLIISSAGKYLSSGQKITLVSGGEGSSFEEISDIEVNNCNASSCGMLKLNTEVSGNNLLLSVDRLTANDLSVSNNSKKIYETLNGAENSGKMQDFLSYLDSKDFIGNELEQTISQLAPQSGKSHMIGSANVVSGSLKTGEMRLDKIRIGADDLPARGSGFTQILSENQAIDVFNLQQQGGSLKNGFWVQPFGGSALQSATSDDIGYKTILSGVALGLDRELSPNLTSGIALSFARSETKSLDSLKKTSANTYQLNFYNSQNFKKFFLDSLGGIAFSQYQSSRSIPSVAARANSNYSGLSYVAKLRTGMTKKINRQMNFIPEISVGFLHNSVGGYTEKGADSLNLNVKKFNSETLEARIGAGLSWSEKISELTEFKKFITVLKTSYGYNFINRTSDVVSNFSGQNSTFNSQTSPIDPSSLMFGAEINGYHIDDIIFSIDYQFERQITYQSHFVALKVRQEF